MIQPLDQNSQKYQNNNNKYNTNNNIPIIIIMMIIIIIIIIMIITIIPNNKLEGIKNMISEGSRLIENAKKNYFLKAQKSLADPSTCRKTYWSLIKAVLNKAKIPVILPLLENDIFVKNFTEKA